MQENIINSAVSCEEDKHLLYNLIQLISLSHRKDSDYTDYVEISSRKIEKVLKRKNHQRILKLAEELNLIKIDHGYSKDEGKCKGYKLVPHGALRIVDSCKSHKIDSVERKTIAALHHLEVTLTEEEIERLAKETVSAKDIRGMILVDEEIEDEQVFVRFKRKRNKDAKKKATKKKGKFKNCHKVSFETAFARAKSWGKSLIMVDPKSKICVIKNLDTYLKDRKESTRQSYANSLLAIRDKEFYAHRNDTNYRLDSNITTLKSDFIPYLRLDGEKIVNIDLSNSQFAFFCHAMLKDLCRPDKSTTYFIDASAKGELYELIQSKYKAVKGKVLTRAEAKSMMFLVAFGREIGENEPNELRRFFRGQFAQVTERINALKPKNNHQNFSVKLQQLESGLFIDKILKKLHKKNYLVLTKHDSVLCKESDLVKVMAIVVQELDKYFGEGNYHLKVEGAEKEQITQENQQPNIDDMHPLIENQKNIDHLVQDTSRILQGVSFQEDMPANWMRNLKMLSTGKLKCMYDANNMVLHSMLTWVDVRIAHFMRIDGEEVSGYDLTGLGVKNLGKEFSLDMVKRSEDTRALTLVVLLKCNLLGIPALETFTGIIFPQSHYDRVGEVLCDTLDEMFPDDIYATI